MYRDSIKRPPVVRHFRTRAENFWRTAEDLMVLDPEDSSAYLPAVGLLAVHCCIALADAVLVATEGSHNTSQDHKEAARRLDKLCSAHKIQGEGIRHFEWLLGKKTHFSYGDKPVVPTDFKMAKLKMDQFKKWVATNFPIFPEEVSDA